MSAPVAHPTQGPPVPPTKPVLSSPGSYMSAYNNNSSSQSSALSNVAAGSPAAAPAAAATAGIHSVNKSHEKPAIAARPIPPPTLPKYSASFSKSDRDRNEFANSAAAGAGGKLDRAEREKDGSGGSYRLASLDRLATRQRILEQNGGSGIAVLTEKAHENGGSGGGGGHSNGSLPYSLQSKREMFFKSDSQQSPSGPPPNPPTSAHNNHANNSTPNNSTPTSNNDKNAINSAAAQSSSVSSAAAALSNLNLNKEKREAADQQQTNGNGSVPNAMSAAAGNSAAAKVAALNNHHSSSNSTNNSNNHHHHSQAPPPQLQQQHSQDSNKMHSEQQQQLRKPQAPQAAAPQPPVQQVIRPKVKEIDGYVGFASLPDQVYRKAVKKGFEFTLMVVGESGLGKSTLINSMFLSDIYNQEQYPGPSHRIKKTVAVETTKVLLKENGVNLTLTVVDTPGFGDAVDNSNCWVPIIEFVESKYEEFLTAESRVHRKALSDNRVHTCLYFIAPSGHGLKPLDVEFMQRLGDKVNIIPVIAKADTMTPEEIQLFKKQILNEIAQHKIKIYDFPEPQEDEDEAKVLRALRSRVPFAIVGANTVVEIDGRKVRGRRYPWGVAEVENLEHCDFIALRNIVIRTHLQDLKDVTNNVHYENYRCRKLAGLGVDGKQSRLSNKNPLAQMEEEKREHELKMKKMEAEMEQVFEMKVKEKKQKLKDSEMELTRRHEERKKALEQSIREMEERKRAFDQERHDWENSNGVTMDELRRRSLEATSKETGSVTSRGSDEAKSRRGFGSLLRRHTSFGASDAAARTLSTAISTGNSQDNIDG